MNALSPVRKGAVASATAFLVLLGLGGISPAQANTWSSPSGLYGYVDSTNTIWVKGASGMLNGTGYRLVIKPAAGVSGGTASVETWSPTKVSKALPGLPEDRKYVAYFYYHGSASNTFLLQKTVTFYT